MVMLNMLIFSSESKYWIYFKPWHVRLLLTVCAFLASPQWRLFSYRQWWILEWLVWSTLYIITFSVSFKPSFCLLVYLFYVYTHIKLPHEVAINHTFDLSVVPKLGKSSLNWLISLSLTAETHAYIQIIILTFRQQV